MSLTAWQLGGVVGRAQTWKYPARLTQFPWEQQHAAYWPAEGQDEAYDGDRGTPNCRVLRLRSPDALRKSHVKHTHVENAVTPDPETRVDAEAVVFIVVYNTDAIACW